MSEPKAEQSQKPILERYAVVIALVAVFIAVPSAPVALIALYQWSTDASGPVLTVSARVNAFAAPVLLPILNGDHADDPPLPPILSGGDLAEMLDEYKAYVTLTLKNTGDLPAEDVRVVLPRFGDLPASGSFHYERSDGEARSDRFVSEFDIGTVEADQLIDVSFWTTEELGESDQLTLSSKSGKEYVRLRHSDEFFVSVARPLVYGFLFGFVVVFVGLLVLQIIAWKRMRSMVSSVAEYRTRMDEKIQQFRMSNGNLVEAQDRLAAILKSQEKSHNDSDSAFPNPD